MDTIEILPWDERFCTGIETIDTQHQELVALLNLLASEVVYRNGQESPESLLGRLAAYAEYHFGCEEEIWARHLADSPLCIRHHDSHAAFARAVDGFKAEVERGEGIKESLLVFVTRWLASHILQGDRYLAWIVEAMGKGQELDYARRRADERMRETSGLLVDILVSFYERLSHSAFALKEESEATRSANERLARSRALLEAIVESSTDMVWAVDALDLRLTFFNKAFALAFSGEAANAGSNDGMHIVGVGQALEDYLVEPDEQARWRDIYRRVSGNGRVEMEMRIGERIYEISAAPLRHEGRIEGIAAFGKDVTTQRQAEDSLEHLAYYDPLTDLPNRRLLQNRLAKALPACERTGEHGGIFFLDLDNFKLLNDTLGHEVGDQLLVEVARRLRELVREEDTVARLGGNEFVVLASRLGDTLETALLAAESIGSKIIATLSGTYTLAGHEHHCRCSIGITLFPEGASEANELIKHADAAMYRAKREGRNRMQIYDPAMQALLDQRLMLENWMHKALPEEFLVYYQPQVDTEDRLIGAEALVRWQHPEQGLISPATFIPLAEETGMILNIGTWVLREACRQVVRWRHAYPAQRLVIAVNVSPRQFNDPGFVDFVARTLRDENVPAGAIKLELTESLLITSPAMVAEKMSALRTLGVRFSLDDFGTGYSSLVSLKNLPLDQIKIDQAFVRDLLTDTKDQAIVRAIIAVGMSLDFNVIAEGVERREHRDYLKTLGCTLYQGYAFGKPEPAATLEARWLVQDTHSEEA